MKRYLWKMIGTLLLLAGLCIFLFPSVYTLYMEMGTQQIVQEYQTQYHPAETDESASIQESKTLPSLYAEILNYNQQIYQEKQSGLTDAWSYEQAPLSLELGEDNLIGYIEIPAMDTTLPLYLGATTENMAKGAVVLGETSIPIGGENTNSVIAGHRGYRGAPYFREIESLSIGDEVYVTNPWETLTYLVTEIKVVNPDDLDAVLIQEGKDMITLVTCHPYRSHGKYRYLVYCERNAETPEALEERRQPDEVPTTTGQAFTSSAQAIQNERLLRIVGAAIILFLIVFTILPRKKKE